MTALSGGSMSEQSFAVSIAMRAAPYTAIQADSLEDPDSSRATSVGSQDGEAIDRAIALVEAASALRSLARDVTSSCLMYSTIGDVGGGLLVEVDGEEGLFRK